MNSERWWVFSFWIFQGSDPIYFLETFFLPCSFFPYALHHYFSHIPRCNSTECALFTCGFLKVFRDSPMRIVCIQTYQMQKTMQHVPTNRYVPTNRFSPLYFIVYANFCSWIGPMPKQLQVHWASSPSHVVMSCHAAASPRESFFGVRSYRLDWSWTRGKKHLA